jgi:hypothetical protein
MNPGDEPPFKEPACTCPHGIGSGGRLYGINMGPEWHRLETAPDCPVHQPPPARRRAGYRDARASMEAAGIDPEAFD